jgi:hypothetical protein
MESQSGGERIENQLQGNVVQNQAVQTPSAARGAKHGSCTNRLTLVPGDLKLSGLQKVVIQLGSSTIKGYLESPEQSTIEELLSSDACRVSGVIRVRRLDSDVVEAISTTDIKAIFYVTCFDGNSDHNPLNFHSGVSVVPGIWVRLKFVDGEVMEGIVSNSIRYLVDPGFFLRPTDPDSNNKLVYVVKSWLADHCVLGMRKLPAAR